SVSRYGCGEGAMKSREGAGSDAPRVQATGHVTLREVLAWVGGWGCVLALAVWLSGLSVLALATAAAGAALWTWAVRGEGRRRWVTVGVLWFSVVVAVAIQVRLHGVATDWPRLQREIE